MFRRGGGHIIKTVFFYALKDKVCIQIMNRKRVLRCIQGCALAVPRCHTVGD